MASNSGVRNVSTLLTANVYIVSNRRLGWKPQDTAKTTWNYSRL